MADALIVSAVRTPVGKAPNGSLRSTRPDELAATVMREVMNRAAGRRRGRHRGRHPRMRHARSRAGAECRAHREPSGRIACRGLGRHHQQILRVGICRPSRLPPTASRADPANAIIAGGTESMSMVPMGGNKVAPNPALVDSYPDVYLTTGPRRGKSRARPRHLARRAGCVRAAQPSARACGTRRGKVPRRNDRRRRVRSRTKARAATRRSTRCRSCGRRFTSKGP